MRAANIFLLRSSFRREAISRFSANFAKNVMFIGVLGSPHWSKISQWHRRFKENRNVHNVYRGTRRSVCTLENIKTVQVVMHPRCSTLCQPAALKFSDFQYLTNFTLYRTASWNVSVFGINGAYYFEEDRTVTVNSQRYLTMIEIVLLTELHRLRRDIRNNELWFQLDRATTHTHQFVYDPFKETVSWTWWC